MAAVSSNSKIELALIAESVSGMRDDIKALRADLTGVLSDHESRLRTTEKVLQSMIHTQEMLTDHEGRIRCVEADTKEIKVQQKTNTSLLVALQIVTGAIASWLGMRQ